MTKNSQILHHLDTKSIDSSCYPTHFKRFKVPSRNQLIPLLTSCSIFPIDQNLEPII